jgi:hypothetical protein
MSLHGADIAKIMSSTGPVVKAVLLHCSKKVNAESNEIDSKMTAANDHSRPLSENELLPQPRVVLTDLIEEIDIDTTPNKSMVQKTLGGPFTFLGQYEDEGIMLMVRNLPDDLEDFMREDENDDEKQNETKQISTAVDLSQELHRRFKVSQLKSLCHERDIDTAGVLEKADLVKALVHYQADLPPYNPHQLQPPLHRAHVRGDILCLKVAETNEELDVEIEDDEKATEKETDEECSKSLQPNKNPDQPEEAEKELVVMENDEFFLDYTKDQYIKFASRTDIPEIEVDANSDDDDEEEDNEQGDGAAFMLGEDGDEIDEEDKSAMFNLVMNEVLRQYREDNGRGPNTKELLELRASIAKELDVKVAEISETDADWDKKAKATPPSAKKIAFDEKDKVKEFVPDENEYNYDDQLMGMENGDHDDDDDVDYSEPPAKRIKISEDGRGLDQEEEDSKPAAIEKALP